MERTTAELLAAAAEGDSIAWNQLIETHAPRVWIVTRRYGFDEATRADIVQTVWLRLAEHLTKIRDPDQLSAWLATCARNEALGVIRRRGRTRVEETFEDTPTGEPDPDHDLVRSENIAAVRAGLAQISADCQRLLGLLVADPPLSYAEIGAALDMAVGSIGPTRGRCLDALRKTAEVRRISEGSGASE